MKLFSPLQNGCKNSYGIYIFKYTFINVCLLAWSAHSNQSFIDSKQLQKFAILFYFISKNMNIKKKEKNSEEFES